MHFWSSLYLSLHAQASERVRPVVQSANSAGKEWINAALDDVNYLNKLITSDNWVAFLQSPRFRALKKRFFFSPREGIHGYSEFQVEQMMVDDTIRFGIQHTGNGNIK